MPFHKKLRNLREDKDLNQTELGEILKTNQKRISRLETGECEPTLSEIAAICRYFNISADELLEYPVEQ